MMDPGVTSRGGDTSMTLNRKHTFNKQSFQSQGVLSSSAEGLALVSHTGRRTAISFFCDTDTVDVKSDKLTVFKPVNNGRKNLTEKLLLSLH